MRTHVEPLGKKREVISLQPACNSFISFSSFAHSSLRLTLRLFPDFFHCNFFPPLPSAMFLGNQASNLGNHPPQIRLGYLTSQLSVTGVFEASREILKHFSSLKEGIFPQLLRFFFIARLIQIKIKMAMIGGPSELKVADEEVQKICDEVCSTFFSNFWCCVTLKKKWRKKADYSATCCTVALTCEKKPWLQNCSKFLLYLPMLPGTVYLLILLIQQFIKTFVSQQVKSAAEAKAGAKFSQFQAKSYKTQVVAGTNFFIKVIPSIIIINNNYR